MADFQTAYNKTMGHEGGYVNDPDDAGGETYKGISRRYHPHWVGWKTIDLFPDSNAGFDDNEALQIAVKDFYRSMYWNVNLLDEFPQNIAEEMFDTGVNMGIGRAAKFLQIALNCLNRNQVLYPDLTVDGDIGSKSLSALKCLKWTDYVILLRMLNVLQGMHYIEYMKKSPTKEKYARGWFNRVVIAK